MGESTALSSRIDIPAGIAYTTTSELLSLWTSLFRGGLYLGVGRRHLELALISLPLTNELYNVLKYLRMTWDQVLWALTFPPTVTKS